MLPKTETSVDFAPSLSRPPLITLGVKVLKISFALAFSGNFTTSNALALWANLLTNPRSSIEERGFVKRLAHKARALEVVKLPENASANDIFNTFTPSVIKGGLDKEGAKSTDVSVLGSIAAGTPIEAIQQEVDRVALPEDLQNNGEHYGLKVKGDSMIEAGINDGDTVIVKKTSNVDSGQIAVVLIDDQEATLKRVRKKGNTIALEAANRNYGTKIYAANRIKIQGKLVSLYRNFH